MSGGMSLSDIMAEEEAIRLLEARAEIEAEKAAWDRLTPTQQAKHIAAMEAKFANVPDFDFDDPEECEDCGTELDAGECPNCE